MREFYFNRETEFSVGSISFMDRPDPCCDISRPAMVGELTVENMVEALDQDAESCNAHPFVGLHRALACVVSGMQGREAAFDFLLRVSQLGGLHQLKSGGAFSFGEQYGVKLDWSPWALPE